MKRRKFLSLSSMATLPIMLNGVELSAFSPAPFSAEFNNPEANARPNVIIPENQLLTNNSNFGFHPSFAEVNEMYKNGFMHIVQGVAYPNQNRSHFRSSDIWTSGSSAENYLDSGWLGRYFQTIAPDFPTEYPNDAFPHPFAMTVGGQVTETCQGFASNFSMAINKPEDLLPLTESEQNNFPDNQYGRAFSYIVDSISQTNAYAEVIKEAASLGNNLSTLYDDDNQLAQQLKTVALLIAGGLKTQVYVVTLGGFDTHANQVEADDATVGVHANLLRTLSKAVNAFWDDIVKLNLSSRVMGMTFSEFGRQIKSNSAYGTDHGTAAPMFIFGDCINPGLSGNLPVIDSQIEAQEGTPMQFDFRSVYGNVLQNWFSADVDTINTVLNYESQNINIFGDCVDVSTTNTIIKKATRIFPNPATQQISVKFDNKISRLPKISFFDHRGSELSSNINLINNTLEEFTFDISSLPTGNYYIHLQFPHTNLVEKFIKIK